MVVPIRSAIALGSVGRRAARNPSSSGCCLAFPAPRGRQPHQEIDQDGRGRCGCRIRPPPSRPRRTRWRAAGRWRDVAVEHEPGRSFPEGGDTPLRSTPRVPNGRLAVQRARELATLTTMGGRESFSQLAWRLATGAERPGPELRLAAFASEDAGPDAARRAAAPRHRRRPRQHRGAERALNRHSVRQARIEMANVMTLAMPPQHTAPATVCCGRQRPLDIGMLRATARRWRSHAIVCDCRKTAREPTPRCHTRSSTPLTPGDHPCARR